MFPNTLDIESCRANALEFLKVSSKSILNEDFDSVSLIALIQFENVRVLLKKAESHLLLEDYPNAIANAAYAFRELLYCYEQNKHRYYKSLFDLSYDFHHIGFHVQLDAKIDHALDEIGDAIECLNERIKILGLGLNYKNYIKFTTLSPKMNTWWDRDLETRYESLPNPQIKFNRKNAQFCIDFVIESAISIQRQNFSTEDLYLE